MSLFASCLFWSINQLLPISIYYIVYLLLLISINGLCLHVGKASGRTSGL